MLIPPVIGHRGAAASAPENTLASFAEAARQGAAMVEFDVRLSADRVPVVFHDDTLTRLKGIRRRVCRLSAAELGRLDIPTLAQVLELCAGLGLAVNMEIKPDRGGEAETADRALAEAARVWPPAAPPPLVSSFARASLEVARDRAPSWPRGLLVVRPPRDWQAQAQRLGCATVNVSHRHLSARRVTEINAAGFRVLSYTVNDPERARLLWSWGVAGIFSDAPGQLLTARV